MVKTQKLTLIFLVFLSITFYFADRFIFSDLHSNEVKGLKLYWFIPDGLRADPNIFQIFQWAENGDLPNIKKMMDQGAYGYSIPTFPGHTPVNFATLLTGRTPDRHGVTDGPIRIPGYQVKRVTASGFRSSTRKVDAIWSILEDEEIYSSLISVPGSTPPDSDDAIVFKGRWGGWGIDLPSLVFQSSDRVTTQEYKFKRAKHFEFGQRMTHFISAEKPQGWSSHILTKLLGESYEIKMNCYGNIFYGLVYGKDKNGQFHHMLISKDKQKILSKIERKKWSGWLEVDWQYRLKEDKADFIPSKSEFEKDLSIIRYKTWINFKAIELNQYGQFRIRFLIDSFNRYLTQPSDLDEERREKIGPIVDFPDNYPPQLINTVGDKETFIDEMNMSFESHEKLFSFAVEEIGSSSIIQNIYSPNQMLTSRWWLGAIDPKSSQFIKYTEDERLLLKKEVLEMYKKIDRMIGKALSARNENTTVVLSSDHGVAALNHEVRLNNLFAKKGWLKFYKDKKTEEIKIDWEKTKVVYLKMFHIYINPNGLSGNYSIQSSSRPYKKLREQVISSLKDLKGPHGEDVLAQIATREESSIFKMDKERVGDLLISNNPPFNWSETVSEDLNIFIEPKVAGYKQAIDPRKNSELWTPFIIVGPGIKKGFRLQQPINHVDQLPTILRSMGVSLEKYDYQLSDNTETVFEN